MPNKAAILVKGFLKNVDFIPPDILVAKPVRRVAVVTSTFNPQVPGSFQIQAPLILDLCRHLTKGLDIEIRFGEKKEARVYNSLDQDAVLKLLSEDLFTSLIAKEEASVKIQITGAAWYKVGGPEIYHDSATLEIFTAENDDSLILEKILQFCTLNGAELQVHEADRDPTPQKLWQRFLRFVLGN